MHQHFFTWKSVFHTTFFGQQWITLPPPPLKPAPPPFKVLTNPGKPTQICVVIFNLLTLDQQEHLKWKQSLGWRFKFSTKKQLIFIVVKLLCALLIKFHIFSFLHDALYLILVTTLMEHIKKNYMKIPKIACILFEGTMRLTYETKFTSIFLIWCYKPLLIPWSFPLQP